MADGAVDILAAARPELPDVLPDRAADVWEPLLAIADLAGGSWPTRARRAAQELSAGSDGEDSSIGVQILADIRTLFEHTDRFPSAVLVARLNELDESPWGEWQQGRGLTQNRLARLLRGFDIRSRSIRLPDGSTPKGYLQTQFVDAFSRYLPDSSIRRATPPQSASEAGPAPSQDRNGLSVVAAPLSGSVRDEQPDVAAVAARAPQVDSGLPSEWIQ